MNNKKITFSLAIFAIILASTNYATYLFASSQNTFTITSGLYPHSPDYTVWREGSTYYAKNSHGYITAHGSNASTILNGLVATSKWVFLKNGVYLLDVDWEIDVVKFRITGESRESTILQATKNGQNVMTIKGTGSSEIHGIQVENVWINGTGASHTKNGLYAYRTVYSIFESLRIQHCYDGMYFDGASGQRGYRNEIRNVDIQNCNHDGFRAYQQDGFNLQGMDVSSCGYGVKLLGHTQGFSLDSVRVDDVTYSALYLQDVQYLYAVDCFISDAGTRNIEITGGCYNLYFTNVNLESAGAEGVYITNNYPYVNHNINFENCMIYRSWTNGLKVVSTNNLNTTWLNIKDCTINNNCQDMATSFSVYADGYVTHVKITNSIIGNIKYDYSGKNYASGIKSYNGCDYWTLIGVDTYTSNSTTKGIILEGSNNKVNLCWNATTWIP